MNVLTEIMVSGYLLQRSLAGSPKLGKKNAKTYTNTSNAAQKLVISILIISQYSIVKQMKTMILHLLYKTNFEFYSLLMYL